MRCAQFGLWQGGRALWHPHRAHPRSGAVTDEQRSHRPNSAQPSGRQFFFGQTSLLAPYRSTSGYARRSRLVWPKKTLPQNSTDLEDSTPAQEGKDHNEGALSAPIKGPLRQSRNPNYFEDARGTPLILCGSQTWNTLQDWEATGPSVRWTSMPSSASSRRMDTILPCCGVLSCRNSEACRPRKPPRRISRSVRFPGRGQGLDWRPMAD